MIIIKILFFFFMTIVIVLLLAAVIGFTYLKRIFNRNNTGNRQYTYTTRQQNSNTTPNTSNDEDKIGKAYAEKIFDKDEGEYVDFEEIPDNNRK